MEIQKENLNKKPLSNEDNVEEKKEEKKEEQKEEFALTAQSFWLLVDILVIKLGNEIRKWLNSFIQKKKKHPHH